MISLIFSSVKKATGWQGLLAGAMLFAYSSEVFAVVSTSTMADFTSAPISLIETAVSPQVLINASQDNQLYYKAYNDYSDLDGDGKPETTYTHSVDYYGYFDNHKCYEYNAALDPHNTLPIDGGFVPTKVTTDKYCGGANEWSGNFLNWSSMTRIDAIRKILFGGHRRVDTSTNTILERAFIPPDIHAFAKYYNGTDIAKLTPFSVSATPPATTTAGNFTVGTTIALTGTSVVVTSVANIVVEDFIKLTDKTIPEKFVMGRVTAISGTTLTLNIKQIGSVSGTITSGNGTLTNHTRTGITLCNVTYSSTSDFSQNITAPPLIRVAAGNYTFWSAGEVTQCLWGLEETNSNDGINYNNPVYSGIYAAQDNPKKASVGLGLADYVARVQVCKQTFNVDSDADGTVDRYSLDLTSGYEKCKSYPYRGTYKPIGLLQVYGDDDKLLFGMVAGTYGKARKGGEMVQKIRNLDKMDGMCREINLGRDCNKDGKILGGTDVGFVTQDDWADATHNIGDGTFKRVYASAGGPIGTTSATKSEGIINTWSLLRIYGYKYGSGNWTYGVVSAGGDNCPLGVNFFADEQDSKCANWGNPFAEIYLSGLRYFAGENSPTDFQSGDGQYIKGINYNTGVWLDPLTSDNYCARLNVVNFNSSVVSADTVFSPTDPDKLKSDLDTSAYGVVPDLGSSLDSSQLTDIIGRIEGIYPDAANPDRKWFVGETGTDLNRVCTAKTITSLGSTRGLCPEGPDLRGGFRTAGIAWYAHTNDIRPNTIQPTVRRLEGIQKVDTYAVRLAAGNPVIEIPVPGSTTKKVTLLPACIDNNKSNYGCTMVDFKIVEPHTEVAGVGRGKFLVIWEDSLQGNDYDLDAGGTIEYTITSSNITISTAITLQNLGYSIGHGFVLSGTTEDGLHIFSGTNSFVYDDPLPGVLDCPSTAKCSIGDGKRSDTFTLGTATAGLLNDPLWYAAKWGGFEDMNGDNVPNLTKEWDSKINSTWESGSDGIPDNYFYASHPQELEKALNRVFMAILERTSSGTAAAVVSNNVRGEGALYQAYYEPLKKDLDGLQASWIGTVHSLWLDKYGFTRQDCSAADNIAAGECSSNGMLDNYLIDQVVQTFYDETEGRTRTKVFTSDNADTFDPYFLEGVVTAYTAGAVTLEPYSMEGVVTDYSFPVMKISPYSMTGLVSAYDPDTGAVTLDVTTLQGLAGASFDNWQIYDQTTLLSGRSSTTMSLTASGSISFVVDPIGDWVAVGDSMTVSTYNMRGEANKTFDSWEIQCLSPSSVSTVSHGVTLVNTGEKELNVDEDVFAGCTRFKLSTFNMHGEAGKTYSSWTVANQTTGIDGTSPSAVTLVNSGVLNFSVLPALAWVEVGDRLMLSNFQFVEKELYDIGYLWNAREELYLNGLTDAQIKTNRLYASKADTGRHIKTWIDKDLDSILDSGEFVDFQETMFPAISYGFFDVATADAAKNIVNYIRGVEILGFRTRKVKYTVDDASPNVMRLGDVINSTPTIVAAPQEAFNLFYNDASYTAFRAQYADRRVVAYVGGNDGMLHAFNGGFYGVVNDGGVDKISYLVNGKNCATGGAATAHPLGSEMWAYAPLNLLPHLKWLKETAYSHVYYMDGKPRVFDAKIFNTDADHPNGWGTVMVVGMGFGGGAMTIDTAANGLGAPNQADDRTMRSAYVIFDITNPENEPVLLAEIQIPDGSFSLVNPAIMAFGDITANLDKWYMIFGNGPNQLGTATSTTNAKVYVLDLDELQNPAINTTLAPPGCSVAPIGSSAMDIITCNTGIGTSFMGSPVVVDWDLDYQADTAYFGLVGDATATSGRIMRMNLAEKSTPSFWSAPTTFALTNQPTVGKPTVGIDNLKNKWVYFGTGRYYAMADKTSIATQTLYGIKDVGDGVPVIRTSLINSTDIDVFTDQTIENGPVSTATSAEITTFPDLVDEVDDFKKGWYVDLPPIVGTAGVAPATRALGQSALLGGVLFTSVFQPSSDPCAGEGYSRLYGLYYKTGTAYPASILGTEIVADGSTVKYKSLPFIELGRGLATSPALHSGSGSGDDSVSVFVQMSTGDIFRQPAETTESVRSGKTSWIEK